MLNKLSMFSKGKTPTAAQLANTESHVKREPVSKNIIEALTRQFGYLSAKDIASYTFEKRSSNQTGARDDLKVFDASGAQLYEGRSFDAHSISFWKVSAATI